MEGSCDSVLSFPYSTSASRLKTISVAAEFLTRNVESCRDWPTCVSEGMDMVASAGLSAGQTGPTKGS